MQQYHILALANLATATKSDRTLVALLTKTILELSGQVVLLTEKTRHSIGRECPDEKIRTAINHSRACTLGVQQHDPVGA